MINQLAEKFKMDFGQAHTNVFFAPGRVNLIGEHIDYNGGLVMPCAITFGTYLLIAPNSTNTFRLRSVNFDEVLDIEVQDSYTKKETLWYNYPVGVIDRFLKSGKKVNGFDMLFFGNIPIGSGLSSSASIEIVTAFALNTLLNSGFTKLDLVKLSKNVENNFIGLNSGIMDQFAVAFGEAHKALQLNCDMLEYLAVDFDLGENVLAIINTNKPRKLAESKYNERVTECKAALKALNAKIDAAYLCDIGSATFATHSHLIKDNIVRKRAQHVIEENERVKQATEALAAGKLAAFGKLMYASHHSL
ncbi:MAG: galactokinase, partial [Chitinophagaceae bacterium]|nr:galactokinase [Chitinophagaceae bacterium]